MIKLCYLKQSSNKLTVTVKVWLLRQNEDSNFSHNFHRKLFLITLSKCANTRLQQKDSLISFAGSNEENIQCLSYFSTDTELFIENFCVRGSPCLPHFMKMLYVGFCSKFNVSDRSF